MLTKITSNLLTYHGHGHAQHRQLGPRGWVGLVHHEGRVHHGGHGERGRGSSGEGQHGVVEPGATHHHHQLRRHLDRRVGDTFQAGQLPPSLHLPQLVLYSALHACVGVVGEGQ